MSNLQPVRDLDYEERGNAEDLELIQLVGMKLGDEEYAIDVLKIQEIIRTVEITSVPRTDAFILGVMNLRGKVIPVIDLRVRFTLDKMDFDKETRIIVVKFETENIGFVVDEVTEVIRINKKMVEPTPPLVGSIGQEYILGICKYQDRLIILLDIDRVVNDGKNAIDSNLKKTLLGQVALPSAEENYNTVADNVEKEFDSKGSEPEPEAPAAESAAISSESAAEEVPDESGMSIDDLIALELAKREQETDELNSKKKEEEETKKKSEIADAADEEAIDDILNDALSQSENNMHSEEGLVEQSELDLLIQKELEKREQETEELNKKKKLTESNKQAPVAEPESPITTPSFESIQEEPETAPFAADDTPSETAKSAENFDIPDDLASEFGLSDLLDDSPLKEEATSENIKDELYTLPEPVDQEIDEEILGSGLPDDFKMPEQTAAEPALATDENEINVDDVITPEFVQEMKAVHNPAPISEQESFDKLKTLSKKIIDGEHVDLGLSIKKEVAELLKLIMETKDRVDDVEPTLITSKEQLPNVVKSLETVTESTEAATMTLMEAADGLTGQYQEFLSEMDDLEDLIYKKDKAAILKKLDHLETTATEADSVGMNILHALEFQDITEQKLNKVIGAVQEVGARLGALLGFIKLKQEADPTTVEDASQDDIDKLLAEFGLN